MIDHTKMKQVTQDEFYRILYADKRDIVPSVREERVTIWESRSREVFGVSYPGWRNPGDDKRYYIAATTT